MPEMPKTVEDWLACIGLPDYVAMLPCGGPMPSRRGAVWTDGNGDKLTFDEYKERWGIDPQVAWDAIKEYRRRAGKKDTVVVL